MLTIYKASAGSGKTYNLAYEYIKLLLGEKDAESGRYRLNHAKYSVDGKVKAERHRHILAITFTNKATDEMKQRIIKELRMLSMMPQPGGDDPSGYAKNLMKEFACTRDDLAQTAHRSLHELLYDFHFFNVSTIDKFFQVVLRTFAREIDCPGDFEISLDENTIIEGGVDAMLDDFNFGVIPQDSNLGRWLRQFMTEEIESGNPFNLFVRTSSVHSKLVKFIKQIGDERFLAYADAIREYLNASDARLQRFAKVLKEEVVPGLINDIRDKAIETLDALAEMSMAPDSINKALLARINKYMLTGEIPPKDDMTEGVAVCNATTPDFPDADKLMRNKSFDGGRLVNELFVFALENYKRLWYIEEIRDSLKHLSFLGFVWNYIDKFRSENNLVLLSDTNDLISRIINGDDTPFIYERLGMQLRHFLIDEFQDTSRKQWENLKPLVENGIVGEHADSLIIGDEKQSIYRFRNSDSKLLEYKVAQCHFPKYHRIRGTQLSENTNWRSSADVVRFNNTFFKCLASIYGLTCYENVVQNIPEKHRSLKGYVRVVAVNEKDDSMEQVCQRIITQHRDGGYKWGDIAILVNANDEGKKIISYLMSRYPEIPVISDEALLLSNSMAVNLIVSVLKIIERSYNADEPTKQGNPVYPDAREVTYMLSRFEYYYSRGMTASDALESALNPTTDKTYDIKGTIATIMQHRPSTMVALVEVIAKEVLSDEERNADASFIAAFQDLVTDYVANFASDLRGFLKWWDIIGKEQAVPTSATQNAVRVMTIHKSKGLEFDCVHIPFGSWKIQPHSETMWIAPGEIEGVPSNLLPPAVYISIDETVAGISAKHEEAYSESCAEQLSDVANKTYVAYTRAVRELDIYYKPNEGIGQDIITILAGEVRAPQEQVGADYLFTDFAADFDAESGCYTLGEPTVADDEEEQKAEVEMVGYPVNYRDDTREITTIESLTDELTDRKMGIITGETDDDIADDVPLPNIANIRTDAEAMAARRGSIMHEMLAHIRTPHDIDRAARRAARKYRMKHDEMLEMKDALSQVLKPDTHPKLRQWFTDNRQVLTERSVYLPQGDMTLRPDRIVFNNDGTIDIVDYKFTSEESDKHHEQVQGYMRLLASMGYEQVNGWLWYPLKNVIARVQSPF